MSSLLHKHSFHVYNKPAATCASLITGMEFTIDSCIQGHHNSKEFWTHGVGLSAQGRQSKRRACNQCKDRHWYCCQPLTEKGFDSLLPVSVSQWYDHVSCHRQQAASSDKPQGGLEVPCTLKFAGEACLMHYVYA